ncbi:MAG: adenylate kinase [Nostocaceae cyanobacterium]|nr:adenylate kinase [Nostocaceae cyanobacterium]
MSRISVVGTSGSGKTTLASQIAERLAIPHVELDYLHWEPNWVEVPDEVMRERVSLALGGEFWVVDGNYSIVRDIVWGRADTVVWLDYSLTVIMSRLLWRTFARSITQEEVCNGNRETLQKAFFSSDSILLWALQTYKKKRREYPLLFQKAEYAHINFLHLRSPKAARDWLMSL